MIVLQRASPRQALVTAWKAATRGSEDSGRAPPVREALRQLVRRQGHRRAPRQHVAVGNLGLRPGQLLVHGATGRPYATVSQPPRGLAQEPPHPGNVATRRRLALARNEGVLGQHCRDLRPSERSILRNELFQYQQQGGAALVRRLVGSCPQCVPQVPQVLDQRGDALVLRLGDEIADRERPLRVEHLEQMNRNGPILAPCPADLREGRPRPVAGVGAA
mmetsp:Transcript_83792/g.164092  ORF Transcript_83792/g.164092 Transcript_83792/m.164092 type:complete len:219 (+) Transcript_83792:3-659(+)